MKNLIKIISTVCVISTAGCASSNEITYKFSEKLSFFNEDLNRIVPIDRFDSREFFLILEKPEKCIRIDTSGFIPKESIAGGEYQIPVYWVLDRLLPGKGGSPQYTEIARNFDADWKALSSSTLCTQENKPIEKLEPGTYRVRTTLFRKENCRIEIVIYSNITFSIQKYTGGY